MSFSYTFKAAEHFRPLGETPFNTTLDAYTRETATRTPGNTQNDGTHRGPGGMQRGAILAPCDCPPPVPGPPTLPEPRRAPGRPCPRAPPATQPCSQPPDNGPRAQAKPCEKSASATVSTLILHQMRMETTAAAAAHAQVDLDTPSNWRLRAPRAPMPSRACAHKGRNGVSDPLQGREWVLGGREGTPISANPPRSCPTTVSASSPATLGKGERGAWAGKPACSQAAPSLWSFSHTRSRRPAAHPQLQPSWTPCSSTSDGAEAERAGASCRSRQ